MVAIYPERISQAAQWSRRCAFFALVLFLVSGILHRFGKLETPVFLFTIGVVVGLVCLALLAFCWAFHRMWVRGDKVGTNLVAAGFLIVVLSIPFGWMVVRGVSTPVLNDISTDTQNRPLLVTNPATGMFANQRRAMTMDEAEAQLEAYPKLIGHSYTLPADRIRQLIATLVDERGWTILRNFPAFADSTSTLNALAGSFILGLPADVAIRVEDEETATYVDMRSASRYGRHDFGDNAMRIERFFTDLDAAVLADMAMPQVAQ